MKYPKTIKPAAMYFSALFVCLWSTVSIGEALSEGIFLVATNKLNNTSFQQTVILVTHNSERGTTGIAINRPSQIPLNKFLPHKKELAKNNDELFLGGPIRPDTIFMLMKTDKPPHTGMFEVAKDLYFTRGLKALTHNLQKKKENSGAKARVYAGYTGWGPGQLNAEIDRGDWQVVRSESSIVFAEDNKLIWQKLIGKKTKPGRWI